MATYTELHALRGSSTLDPLAHAIRNDDGSSKL